MIKNSCNDTHWRRGKTARCRCITNLLPCHYKNLRSVQFFSGIRESTVWNLQPLLPTAWLPQSKGLLFSTRTAFCMCLTFYCWQFPPPHSNNVQEHYVTPQQFSDHLYAPITTVFKRYISWTSELPVPHFEGFLKLKNKNGRTLYSDFSAQACRSLEQETYVSKWNSCTPWMNRVFSAGLSVLRWTKHFLCAPPRYYNQVLPIGTLHTHPAPIWLHAWTLLSFMWQVGPGSGQSEEFSCLRYS